MFHGSGGGGGNNSNKKKKKKRKLMAEDFAVVERVTELGVVGASVLSPRLK